MMNCKDVINAINPPITQIYPPLTKFTIMMYRRRSKLVKETHFTMKCISLQMIIGGEY